MMLELQLRDVTHLHKLVSRRIAQLRKRLAKNTKESQGWRSRVELEVLVPIEQELRAHALN